MRRMTHLRGLAVGLGVLLGLATLAAAQDNDQATLQKLLERIAKLEAEVERLKTQPGPPAPPQDQPFFALIENPYLGQYYQQSGPASYLVAKLIVVNPQATPLNFTRGDIRMEIDGTPRKLEDVPSRLQPQAFSLNNQYQALRNLNPVKELKVPAGGTASTWLVYPDVPTGGKVPQLTLKLRHGDATKEININEQQRAALGLTVERIGPRGSLGLVTISGGLNSINAQSLVRSLDELADRKVVRVVLRWAESAPPLDQQALHWLQQSALSAGRNRAANQLYPSLPTSLREFHLAELPSAGNTANAGHNGNARIHKTAQEAVAAALKSAYEILPRDELLQEIQEGHVLTRAAALAHGGGRLGPERLPLILQYADDSDPKLQLAALEALSHFGEPDAIGKLLHYARKNVEPLASQAIESLAGSRYTAAHEALLELLKNEQPAVKKSIVQVLAKYPRPIWSETIYEYVHDSRAGLNIEALRALVRVGHPKLVDVLEEGLQSKDQTLRTQSFAVLATRTDERSEQLAMDYALESLKSSPPDGQMVALLSRTKDPRAVPLLMKHLEKASEKATIINLLAQIGDQSLAEVFLRKYPSLQTHEKAAVLNGLRQLHSPKFRELAGQALLTNDSQLISTAAQGLQNDGSPEAVKLLTTSLEKATTPSAWSYLCNALGQIGTAEARTALLKARESGDQNKRNYAVSALQNLRVRSPGYQYINQAEAEMRDKHYAEAREQYEMALQLDPNLPEAYVGRGNVLLKDEKFAEAGQDFAKAVELDPYNSMAITGHALCLVMGGKSDDGLQVVEKSRERFKTDMLFRYNAACVYGRAAEQTAKNSEDADRAEKVRRYQQTALDDLRQSVKLGFQDFALMKDDPDLSSLRDLPEYRKLAGDTEKDASKPQN